MSIVRSDNRKELHPKPVQEYERRFNGTVYVDWANISEVEAAYSVAYRANKYFWIAGLLYHCTNGVTYRLVTTGASQIIDVRIINTANTLDVSQLSGNTFIMAVKGAQPFNSDYISQSGITLDFTSVGGVVAGELITIFYK